MGNTPAPLQGVWKTTVCIAEQLGVESRQVGSVCGKREEMSLTEDLGEVGCRGRLKCIPSGGRADISDPFALYLRNFKVAHTIRWHLLYQAKLRELGLYSLEKAPVRPTDALSVL